MDFRHLVYFVAVAEELHFSRAAERLHIVQPALSQQISKLEGELGVSLLNRNKRSVSLTDSGAAFLEDARKILELRDRAVGYARTVGAGLSGTVSVGYVGPAGYSVLPPVLRAFRRSFPNVDLRLNELTTSEQLDNLTAGTIDLGILRLPLQEAHLETATLLTESVVVVLPADHPLAGLRKVALGELSAERFITVPRSRERGVYDKYLSLCLDAGFSPHITAEAHQIHTIIGLVASGLGVALAPASIASLSRPDVVYARVTTGSDATLRTGLAWRRDSTSALVRRFVDTARATIPTRLLDLDAATTSPLTVVTNPPTDPAPT